MRKFSSLIICLNCFIVTMFAQVEVKINPGNIVINKIDVAAELIFKEKYGLEITSGYTYGHFLGPLYRIMGGSNFRQSGYRLRVLGKYYFNPETIGDGVYLGPYAGPKRFKLKSGTDLSDVGDSKNAFSIGAMGGYKFFLGGNFFFDVQIGVGYLANHRNDFGMPFGVNLFNWDVEFPSSIVIGYRFKKR